MKIQDERKLHSEQVASTSFKGLKVESSSTGSSSGPEMSAEEGDGVVGVTADTKTTPGPSKCQRVTKSIVSPSLAAVLDRTKMIGRKTVFILGETACFSRKNVDKLSINQSSIQQQ